MFKNSLFLSIGQFLSGVLNNQIVQGLIISFFIAFIEFGINYLRKKNKELKK